MARYGISTLIPLVALAPVVLGAAMTVPVAAREAAISLAAAQGQPREVTAFLRRRAGCNRLSGEDGEDPERVAETVKSRFWMKCGTLPEDERRLRARYADSPSVLDALDQGGDFDNADD